MPNAGIVAKGDALFKELVVSGLAQELEKIVKDLEDGNWGIEDLVEITVEEDNNVTSHVSVITPHHTQKAVNTDFHHYAIDRKTYELIIQTSKGWTRTGYIVRFVRHH